VSAVEIKSKRILAVLSMRNLCKMNERRQFRSLPTINFSRIRNESFIGRLVRTPLRLIPQRMVVPILQGPLRGKKWIAGSSNHGCWIGSYELKKQQAFYEAVRPGDVVYDIGANVGFYSLLASVRVGPRGHVFCFEPLPENVADLRKHIAMNHLANCEVIEAAVSSTDGTARFDSSRPRSMGWLSELGDQAVRTVCLDMLVSSNAILPPKVLKIDVEGAEVAALQGCAQTLAAHPPIIFLATHGPAAHGQCVQFLTERKYKIRSLNSLSVDRSDELLAVP
jgi:FkbM family methyltransferase